MCYRPKHFVVVVFLALTLLSARGPAAHEYPKTACFYPGDARIEHCEALSKYDLVILGSSTQDFCPGLPDTLRSLNPDIILLAYYPCCFVWARYESMPPTPAAYGHKIADRDWWLYDTKGYKIGNDTAQNLYFVNFSPACPLDGSGQTIAEWLAHYIAQNIISTGLWDGIFIDGPYENPIWINNSDHFFADPPAAIDADRDGIADHPDSVHAWWRGMLESFLVTLKGDIGDSYVLVGNGGNTMSQYLHGGTLEAFPYMLNGWDNSMYGPYGFDTMSRDWLQDPINATLMLCYYRNDDNTQCAPKRTISYERFLRYTLTSALLSDGYYYMGDPHKTLWWEDLYDLDLGDPTGDAYPDSIWNSVYGYYCPVWKREFENATIICNPGPRYAILSDGTWIVPEDGLIQPHVTPCCLDVEITGPSAARFFNRGGTSIEYNAALVNASDNAAYGYIWTRLTAGGDTVLYGNIRQFLIGAGDSIEKFQFLRVTSPLPKGTYCLEVFVGGPNYVPTDHDTIYVTRTIDFRDTPRKSNDSGEEGNLGVRLWPSVTRDGRTRLEVTGSPARASVCTVKIYDVRGRLISTVLEGELDQGAGLEIDLSGEGGEFIAPGVYYVSAKVRGEIRTGKIVLLR
ncbi:MAG: putative glycoside hydrolase [Candidatus Eisenbacteria bacterium]